MDRIDRFIIKLVYNITYWKYKYLVRKYERTAGKLTRTLAEITYIERSMR